MALMPQETVQYIPKVLSNMPGAGATLNQNTVINISGVSDPKEGKSSLKAVATLMHALPSN